MRKFLSVNLRYVRGITFCVLAGLLSYLFVSCQHEGTGSDVRLIAEQYFSTYAARTDWEKFLSYYAETLEFEDIILQESYHSLASFREFYNWPDSGFVKHPDYPKVLVIDELIVHGKTAIGKGRLNPFYWYGRLFEMKDIGNFIIWLEFNDQGKIIKQTDWIEYPGDILESVGKRMQE